MKLIILAIYITILMTVFAYLCQKEFDKLSTQVWEAQQQISNQIAVVEP